MVVHVDRNPAAVFVVRRGSEAPMPDAFQTPRGYIGRGHAKNIAGMPDSGGVAETEDLAEGLAAFREKRKPRF